MSTDCPICMSVVSVPAGTEESEVLSCQDCGSRLVVTSITATAATVEPAPEVEEDWGQ